MSYKVYLSPSNQTDNRYAYGNTTEAVQCGICDYFGVTYEEKKQTKPEAHGALYCVQVGAFADRANAEKRLQAVKVDYPDAFIWTKEAN